MPLRNDARFNLIIQTPNGETIFVDGIPQNIVITTDMCEAYGCGGFSNLPRATRISFEGVVTSTSSETDNPIDGWEQMILQGI